MLYYPWRNEKEELININAKRIFDEKREIIKENRKHFVFNSENDTEIHNEIELREKTLTKEYTNDNTNGPLDDEYFAYECASAFHEFDIATELGEAAPSDYVGGFNKPQNIPESDYFEMVRKLNSRQRDYLMHVMNEIKTTGGALKYFVSGSAGTGKTLLIKVLYHCLMKHYNKYRGCDPSSVKVLLCAPTGKAAFNIEGMTLHSAFALPVNQCGKQMSELSAEVSNTLCVKFANLKALIIDEISMMGSQMLNNVNRRLRDIFKNEEDFGGISVFLFGDLRQLPPVGDSLIFLPSRSDILGQIIGTPTVLWENFKLFELTEIMRQKDDKNFANALCNLAEGRMTQNDISLILSRVFDENTLPNEARKYLNLFLTNSEKDHYNNIVLSKMNTEGTVAESVDCTLGHGSESVKKKILEVVETKKVTETYGLPQSILLKLEARYMVTNNLDIEDGLVNGSTGILKKIQYGTLKKNNILIPVRLWLEFESNRVGIKARSALEIFRKNNNIPDTWTPVELITRQIHSRKSSNLHVVRRQFPIVPAEGITIHKSQGSTYNDVVVHLNKKMTRQALYVACSRSTKASGLYLIGNFTPPLPPKKTDTIVTEMQRLRKDPLIPKFQILHEPKTELQIIFHNIQSLQKHLPDITSDACFMSSDILLFAETWSLPSDEVKLEGFEEIARVDCSVKRKSQGVAAFIKENLFMEISGVKKIGIASSPRIPHSEAVQFEIFNIKFTVLYFSPKSNVKQVLDMLKQIIFSEGSQIVSGDFNIDFKNEQGKKVINFFLERGLSKIGPEYISTTDSNTEIDGVFSNITCVCNTYESLFSYHKPLWFQINHP